MLFGVAFLVLAAIWFWLGHQERKHNKKHDLEAGANTLDHAAFGGIVGKAQAARWGMGDDGPSVRSLGLTAAPVLTLQRHLTGLVAHGPGREDPDQKPFRFED